MKTGTTTKTGRSRARRERKATPLMEQYHALKQQHPDAILFFRLGDFYEMFFEDAKLAARLLGLTLTSRNRNDPNPVPLAGVPWHQRDVYVARLLRHGHKVAICEQLQDAAEAKGIVKTVFNLQQFIGLKNFIKVEILHKGLLLESKKAAIGFIHRFFSFSR